MSYTVNIKDPNKRGMEVARRFGYHAYCANGITAIETKAKTRAKARRIATAFGEVLYIFE